MKTLADWSKRLRRTISTLVISAALIQPLPALAKKVNVSAEDITPKTVEVIESIYPTLTSEQKAMMSAVMLEQDGTLNLGKVPTRAIYLIYKDDKSIVKIPYADGGYYTVIFYGKKDRAMLLARAILVELEKETKLDIEQKVVMPQVIW